MKNSGGFFDIATRREKIAELEKLSAAEGFWDNNQAAQVVLKEINSHKIWVDKVDGFTAEIDDLKEMIEIAGEDASESDVAEMEEHVRRLSTELDEFEFTTQLSGADDIRDAIITIHPGAGGTESMDWAEMLFRMYNRWAERRGFAVKLDDYQPGEEAGLKSATMEIRGEFAYGYLKSESGVHRLVRISPFDANKRRHTSFCSVHVFPLVEDNIEIEIKEDDLRIDTYRASGAGGQHVNKTSSAVRITHLPTNIVVQCQSERSQHKNRDSAMRVLKARLYQQAKEEERKKMAKYEDTKKKIEWGSQIRSYVFHPYNMVKDHRTASETSNVQAVMDGDIEQFIKAYLSDPQFRDEL